MKKVYPSIYRSVLSLGEPRDFVGRVSSLAPFSPAVGSYGHGFCLALGLDGVAGLEPADGQNQNLLSYQLDDTPFFQQLSLYFLVSFNMHRAIPYAMP